MNKPDLEVLRVEIAKLELKPGDILAVRVPLGTPAKMIERINEHLREILSPENKGFVYTDAVELSVITHAE